MRNKILKTGLLAAALFMPACATTVSVTDSKSESAGIETIVPERWQRVYDTIHYAPAVKAGDFLFLSGVVASSREGMSEEESYDRAFKTMEAILKEGGATWDDVIEFQTFHTDLPAQIDTFSLVKDRYVAKPYPAWTAIDIDRLYPDNGIVEIKITAYVGLK